MHKKFLIWVSELQAIAQSGLAYSINPYDIERFKRLREISAEAIATFSEHDFKTINTLFSLEKGYATPKLDVRSVVFQKENLLLVKERSDGLWSLPGGWIDVNESPSESVVRETKEETGYDVKINKLLAIWDKLKHDHPPQWPHIYKIMFACEITGGEPSPNLEIEQIGFFNINKLPDLSLHRVTESQIKRLYHLVINNVATEYD